MERMREMYSAELALAELRELERLLRTSGSFGELANAVQEAIAAFPLWDRALAAILRQCIWYVNF